MLNKNPKVIDVCLHSLSFYFKCKLIGGTMNKIPHFTQTIHLILIYVTSMLQCFTWSSVILTVKRCLESWYMLVTDTAVQESHVSCSQLSWGRWVISAVSLSDHSPHTGVSTALTTFPLFSDIMLWSRSQSWSLLLDNSPFSVHPLLLILHIHECVGVSIWILPTVNRRTW